VGDTVHLTATEFGAYMLLLISMWRNGAWLPNDERLMARYATLTSGQWKRSRGVLLPFFTPDGDRITQGRLMREWVAVEQKSNSAKNSANARWLKEKRTADANASNSQCDRNAIHYPLSKEEGGGGSAGARDDPDLPPDEPNDPALLDRVIEAAQIDIQRDRSPQRWFGSEPRHTIEQWQGLGLTDAEIIETVSEVMVTKHDGPPAKLSYFNPAMQRRAGQKARPDLMPIDGGKTNDGKSARERRAEANLASDLAFARDLDRAAAGGP
jgi:uncharacterized protein YdaU (DUF1376 family)